MSGSGTLRYVDTTERLMALLMSCRAKCMPFVTALQQQTITINNYKQTYNPDQSVYNCHSDDKLASFRRLFLAPVNWYQKLVNLSYFSGARNQRRLEHVQFRAGNRLES